MAAVTPTALSEDELSEFLEEIVPILPMDHVREYTVEAGRPDTITRKKLETILQAGASRISINPQTMQDKTLRLIGRNHTTEQFVETFQMARDVGFGNINCDLIAGLPEESLDDFRNTLTGLQALNPESVTVHTMAVKRASRLKEEIDQFQNSSDEIVSENG